MTGVTAAVQVATAATPSDLYAVTAQVIPVLAVAIVFQTRFQAPTLPVDRLAKMRNILRSIKELEADIDAGNTATVEAANQVRVQIADLRDQRGDLSRRVDVLLTEHAAEVSRIRGELRTLKWRAFRLVVTTILSPAVNIGVLLVTLVLAVGGEMFAIAVLAGSTPTSVGKSVVIAGLVAPFMLLRRPFTMKVFVP